MKLTILILMLIIIPSALAIYGGESETVYSFDECNNFTVDVTGNSEIEEGEYSLEDCIKIGLNRWSCIEICNLTITTEINTVNEYTFMINYSYLVNSTVDLTSIRLDNEDILIKEMKYISNVLEFELESDGSKTVKIYIGDLGCPYKVYVNSIDTQFTCKNKYVTFDAVFSTNNIKLDYNFPVTETSDSDNGGSSSGSRGGRLYNNYQDMFKEGGRTVNLNYGDVQQFYIDEKRYSLVILRIEENSTKLRISPGLNDFVVEERKTKEIDLNKDGSMDFKIRLNEIKTRYSASFTFTILEESIIKEKDKPDESKEEIVKEEIQEITEDSKPIVIPPVEKSGLGMKVLVFVLVIGGIGLLIFGYYTWRKKSMENEDDN